MGACWVIFFEAAIDFGCVCVELYLYHSTKSRVQQKTYGSRPAGSLLSGQQTLHDA